MRILFVASEIYPLVKTGGLADVIGSLPRALAKLGAEMRCLVPGYPGVLPSQQPEAAAVATGFELFGSPARLLERCCNGIDLVVLDAPHLFDRPGNPYLGSHRQDWPDNHRRFAGLAQAAVRIADGALPGWRPDLIHCHDWQAGLVPAYLALRDQPRPATVMTVHNLAYQGLFPANLRGELGLPEQGFRANGYEYWGQIGFLKAGLFYADRLTTVSPTFAREIQQPANGLGLDGLLRHRSRDLTGILNGIDQEVWNPRTDPHLAAAYGPDDIAGKAANKVALQRQLGLDSRPGAPLAGVISRLTPEKGLDLLLEVLPYLVGAGGQLVMLGTGQAALEQAFLGAAGAAPDHVAVRIGHDEELAHLIQGGADVIAMPSRMEPCGLTQMYGMRYGTLPLVGKVGGLVDSVVDATPAAIRGGVATGFTFSPTTASALRAAFGRALDLYAQKERWRRLQVRAMGRDFGWTRAAERYLTLYRELVSC